MEAASETPAVAAALADADAMMAYAMADAVVTTDAAATADDAKKQQQQQHGKQSSPSAAAAPTSAQPSSIIQDWRALSIKLSRQEFEAEVALERKRRETFESSSQVVVPIMERVQNNNKPPPLVDKSSNSNNNNNRKRSPPTSPVAPPPPPPDYPLTPSPSLLDDDDEGPAAATAAASTTTLPGTTNVAHDANTKPAAEPLTVEETTRTDNEIIDAIIAEDNLLPNSPAEDVVAQDGNDDGNSDNKNEKPAADDDDKKPAAVANTANNDNNTSPTAENSKKRAAPPSTTSNTAEEVTGTADNSSSSPNQQRKKNKHNSEAGKQDMTMHPMLGGVPTLPSNVVKPYSGVLQGQGVTTTTTLPHRPGAPPVLAPLAATTTPMQALQQLHEQQYVQQLLQERPRVATTPMQAAQQQQQQRQGGPMMLFPPPMMANSATTTTTTTANDAQQQQRLLQMPLPLQQQPMFGFPGLLPTGGGMPLLPPWMMTQPIMNPMAAAAAGGGPIMMPNMMMGQPPLGGQMMLMPGGGMGLSPQLLLQQQQQMQGFMSNMNNNNSNNSGTPKKPMTKTMRTIVINWEHKFQQLSAYKEKFGHVDVSPTDGKEYEQLSRWLGTQRYRWKQALKKEDGGLSFEQVERLHLLGVTLHRTADRHARISLRKKKLYGQTLQEQIIANQKAVQEWDSMYRQLVSYKNEKGHCKVPVTDKQLYRWVAKQREQWKLAQSNDPKAQITPSQIQQLVQIGLGTSIGPTNPRWEALFAELKKFKQEHGHLRVPSMEKEFAALYKWVIRQRQDWRKVLNGDTSTGCLDTEQIERLIDIGLGNASGPFDFNSEIKAQEWNDKYNLLVEFHKEHQHAEVIDRKEPDQYSSLAAWIKTQRASYQNRQSIAATGEKKDKKGGVMTDDQFKKLKALGMRMEVIKQPDFDTRFAQLANYIAVHGHSRVPSEYAESDYLGGWVRRTRQLYHEDKLPQEQVVKLDMIGMDWRKRAAVSRKNNSH